MFVKCDDDIFHCSRSLNVSVALSAMNLLSPSIRHWLDAVNVESENVAEDALYRRKN